MGRRYVLTRTPLKYSLQGGSNINNKKGDRDMEIDIDINIDVNPNGEPNVVKPNIDPNIVADEKDNRCAPGINFEDGSCMSLNLLYEMAKAYNNNNQDKIDLENGQCNSKTRTLNPSKCKRYLLKQFSSRLQQVCDDQRCWLKQDFMKQIKKEIRKEAQNTFRPKGPEGKFEWLNTFNINDVMSQYEKVHPDFKFLGAVPVDFDSLPNLGVKDLDYAKLKKEGVTKLGIVFNLDEHHKSGSHWVASFTDLKSGNVYYFDSYGVPPEPRIRKYLRRCAHHCHNGGTDVRTNEVRHQRGNNACGVYSLNFIIRMLEGETFDQITEKVTTDSEVNRFREVYFT